MAGGRAWWGHAWQGACVAGGMHGSWGVCMVVGGCAWQEDMRGGGGHACHAHTPGRYYVIRSMSGQYTSYWNAFLFTHLSEHHVFMAFINACKQR